MCDTAVNTAERLSFAHRISTCKEGKGEDFDRPIAFFGRLVAKNPADANAYLNYGLAYVDKVPVVDAITRIGVANSALTQLSKSIELRRQAGWATTRVAPTYLFWPKFFGSRKAGLSRIWKLR